MSDIPMSESDHGGILNQITLGSDADIETSDIVSGSDRNYSNSDR